VSAALELTFDSTFVLLKAFYITNKAGNILHYQLLPLFRLRYIAAVLLAS